MSTALIASAVCLVLPIAFLLGAALHAAQKMLNEKAAESRTARVASSALEVLSAIIHDVASDIQPKLLAAASDGVFTPEERESLKASVTDEFKKVMGSKGLAELQKVLAVEAGSMGVVLGGMAESVIRGLEAKRPAEPVGLPVTADVVAQVQGAALPLAPALAAK